MDSKSLQKLLPLDKQTFSREAVEVLIAFAFEAGKESIESETRRKAEERSRQIEDERERIHGPMWI